eukprot:TRINITY_DN10006_c0_g1_i1.p1 TRINITY_DN10006_c0_g1~~TRINITY_DN10006_c0_g1_i1.p1  ORF type:complete len:329 (+),score=55.30 TRINITY_DN10006_c0_g1_i1:585-1571(+)
MKHDMKGQPTVIVEDVADYRAVIPEVVKEGDVVLEVGCHEGVTTRRIARAVGETGRVYGVDTSEVCIERSKVVYQNEENLSFHVGDALDVSSLIKLAAPRRYDVVFIDISGSRDLETLLPLMEAYEAALRPRTLVVKSFRLKRLYVNCTLFQIHPAPAATKTGPTSGNAEWRGVTQTSLKPLPKPPKPEGPAKGFLPLTDDGELDAALLPANVKCNAKLEAWGSGRTARKEKRKQKKEEKETNPELRDATAKLNALRGAEEHQRSLIQREYHMAVLKDTRVVRTIMREIEKKSTSGPVLRWCKPLGNITWGERCEGGAEKEAPEADEE